MHGTMSLLFLHRKCLSLRKVPWFSLLSKWAASVESNTLHAYVVSGRNVNILIAGVVDAEYIYRSEEENGEQPSNAWGQRL